MANELKLRSFRYLAEDSQGKLVRGEIKAFDKRSAFEKVSKQRLTALEIGFSQPISFQSLNVEDSKSLPRLFYVRFLRVLSEMLTAGVFLGHALSICASQEPHRRAAAFVERLANRIQIGESLSAALETDKIKVPALIISTAQIGEASGDFGKHFERLADSLEEAQRFRRAITGELIYPAALLVLIIITIIILSVFILPRFELIFDLSNSKPPAVTSAVLATGAMIRNWWWAAGVALIVLLLIIKQVLRSRRTNCERLILSIPILGSLLKKIECGRYFRTLGVLTENGVPLAASLKVAGGAVNNQFIKLYFENASRNIREGSLLSREFSSSFIVPSEVVHLIAVGEETGRLGAMTMRGAVKCESDVRSASQRIVAIAGPLLTAIMGGVVASVIAAVMIGVLSLNEAVF